MGPAATSGWPSHVGLDRLAGHHLSEVEIRHMISALEAMTDQERQQVLPAVFNAIASFPNAQVRGQLSWALNQQIARWTKEARTSGQPAGGQVLEEIRGTPQEREGFDTLRKQREQRALMSEDEIRKQIETLAVDPQKPEIGLTRAMELARVIDGIQDPMLQTTLRKFLTDRLIALQADL